jgi:enoyl-CoA hydratase
MPPETSPSTAARMHYEAAEGIATLTADNADRYNALTADMWDAIPGLIGRAEGDPSVRIIVLRGAGTRAFSAGADISEFDTQRTGGNARHYDQLNEAAFNAVLNAAKPTLAMIHGFCLGGGLGIAACCDLRLADDKAQFAIPAAKLGLGYNPRWVRTLLTLAPAPRVKELLFTGRRFSAGEALAMGLVNKIVAPDALEAETRALAAEIAANAPLTIKAAKAAINAFAMNTSEPGEAVLHRLVTACFESRDYAEGRRAFQEKRKPQFEGQ